MNSEPIDYSKVRASVKFKDHVLSVPLEREAVDALENWLSEKRSELVAVLAPFDLHPFDLLPPTWRQIVPAEQFEIGVQG